jgi:hypothetical protein
MNSQEQNIIIKPKSAGRFPLIIALIVLPFFAYRQFLKTGQHPDEWFHWFDLGFLTLLWLFCVAVLMFNKKFTKKGTITLTPEGFLNGTTLYRWREIEQFGITTQYATGLSLLLNRKAIFWNYKSSSLNISPLQKFSKLIFGYHDSVYSNYEIETEKLAQLLNDWRFRYAGTPSEVLQGAALDQKISNTTFFFIVGIIIIMIVTFVLFSMPTHE